MTYWVLISSSFRLLNDKWALQKAKENVDAYFPVVGVLEELNKTLAVLEDRIPIFFKGVQHVYFKELLGGLSGRLAVFIYFSSYVACWVCFLILEPHKNRNRWKPRRMNQLVKRHLKNQLSDEYDFYNWIRSRLRAQYVKIENKWATERRKREWHRWLPNHRFEGEFHKARRQFERGKSVNQDTNPK